MGFFRDQLGKTYEELTLGQKASFSRRVTKQDVLQYMGLSGDLNPLYADSAYAGRTAYQHPIVPANMLAGYVMGAVALSLPGLGSLTHAHTYRLGQPARVGDEVIGELEVQALNEKERRIVISYRLHTQDGREVLTGEIEVEPPGQLSPVQHAYETF